MKTIDVLHITPEEYQKYVQVQAELERLKNDYGVIKCQRDEYIKALKEIHSYDGNNEDAIKLKDIADDVLWRTLWDVY